MLAVLSSLSFHAFAKEDNCMKIFNSMQQHMTFSDVTFTASVSDMRGAIPFLYQHIINRDKEYVMWSTLNGESEGYALRDLEGFDFNEDKAEKRPLTWHVTEIFDRLVTKKTKLQGYQCIFSGRTRLNGRKVSLLRLLPRNDLRYGMALAVDEEQALPVELNIVSPEGSPVTKISATDIRNKRAVNIPPDADFDHFSLLQNADSVNLDPWGFLKIPPYFVMQSQGAVRMPNGEVSPYQQFSDGVFSFRVYINSITSMSLPEVSAGVISIYRMHDANREYAVVGDIPMKLAKSILSDVLTK